MPDLVIRLDEKLAWLSIQPDTQVVLADKDLGRRAVDDAIRAALDSPPVEEGREFRVVGRPVKGGSAVELFTHCERGPTRDLGDIYRAGDRFTDVRDQSRTITTLSDGSTLTGPWTDLPGEGEQ